MIYISKPEPHRKLPEDDLSLFKDLLAAHCGLDNSGKTFSKHLECFSLSLETLADVGVKSSAEAVIGTDSFLLFWTGFLDDVDIQPVALVAFFTTAPL